MPKVSMAMSNSLQKSIFLKIFGKSGQNPRFKCLWENSLKIQYSTERQDNLKFV